MKKDITKPDIKELEKAFGGDLDLFLFFVTWVKNNMVAKFAYKELHPNVTDASAEVLGSRMLSRVKPEILMPVYGLGVDVYMKQLRDGLEAMKKRAEIVDRDKKGAPVYEYYDEPDHITRKFYHDKLGKLLGIEQHEPSVLQQFNVGGKMELEFIGDESQTIEMATGSSEGQP